MAGCTVIADGLCQHQCGVPSQPLRLVLTHPDYVAGTEQIEVYVLAVSSSGCAYIPFGALGSFAVLNPSDGWKRASVSGTSGSIKICLYPGQYKLKIDTTNFTTGETPTVAIYGTAQCVIFECTYDLTKKQNACGELGADRVSAALRFFVAPSGSSIIIDGTVAGLSSESGLTVCVTAGQPHTLKLEKAGYITRSTTFTPGIDLAVSTVPGDVEFDLTRMPSNACGEYVENGQTHAKMKFTSNPVGSTVSIDGINPFLVPAGGATICLPAGNLQATCSKPGYATKTINIPITEDMCETQSIYSVETIILSETVVANFTINPISPVDAGTTVYFTDTSTGSPTSWEWAVNWTSGSSSGTFYKYTQNFSVILGTPGTYSASLTVTNDSSSDTITKVVAVNEVIVDPPVVSFITSPTVGIVGQPVRFYGFTTNDPYSWAWWLDDGGSGIKMSSLQNAEYTFASPGEYSIRFTATNPGGTGVYTSSVLVSESPQCPASCPDGYHCDGESTNYECVASESPMNWMGIIIGAGALGYILLSKNKKEGVK
jgi:PKD repeat protein